MIIRINNDIKLPPAFSGHAQLLLYTRYGDPRMPGWDNKWITTWKIKQLFPWFPKDEIRIHKHFWPMLRDAFSELEQLGLHTEIRSFNCCYQLSHLYNSPVLSVHSWGAAIDLNSENNPKGSVGTWSNEFIFVMEKHGISCGQNWTGTKEPMHFAMIEG
jgi:hypothetical protein